MVPTRREFHRAGRQNPLNLLSRFAGEFRILPFTSLKPGLLDLNSESSLWMDNKGLPQGCVFRLAPGAKGKTGDKLEKNSASSVPRTSVASGR